MVVIFLEIVYSKSAAKAIKSLDNKMKQRMKTAIEGLIEIPPKGDIKKLQGANPVVYRLRIGKYRVIYKYDDEKNILFIKAIGSRGDIYN